MKNGPSKLPLIPIPSIHRNKLFSDEIFFCTKVYNVYTPCIKDRFIFWHLCGLPSVDVFVLEMSTLIKYKVFNRENGVYRLHRKKSTQEQKETVHIDPFQTLSQISMLMIKILI